MSIETEPRTGPSPEPHHPERATRTVDEPTGVVELRLPNGLLALLLPRSSAPVVAVQTWYRVGSREESKGKTGLAHFLEHLLFKGTDTLRKGDIDLVTLRNGGQNNADTSNDRTRYYFTFASDRWEAALEIEADRMRGSIFDEYEFQAERGPVLEELRRDHDDPWWRLHEALSATAYHVHPYRNPVIGWAEEVIRVPREDVLAFYDAWYRPNNCTVVVVGDIDVDRAAARIEELFGGLPSAPLPEPFVPVEPPQEGERRLELEMPVNVPRMGVTYHTVSVRDEDEAVLDAIQAILTGGKSSRLYDRLVRRDRLVTEVSAWNDARRDAGVFTVFMEMRDGASREAAERALFEELDGLGTDGPTPDELERARSQLRAGTVYMRRTAAGLADTMGTYQVLAGDWRLYLQHDAAVQRLDAERVRAVAARYLRRANRTVGWVLPRPADAPPIAPLPGDSVHQLGEPPEDTRGAPELLQRDPPRGRLRVDLPVHEVTLGNGLRCVLLPRTELPMVAVQLWVDGGRLRERKPGQAALMGVCLDEGAAGRSGVEIARVVESTGAVMSAGAAGGALRCLREHVGETLDVLADVLLRPDFPIEAVERKRAELLSALLAEDDDPGTQARLRLRSEIYGVHPYGRRDKGSAEALKALTREDLVAHHDACFVPRGAVVVVVGDFDVGEMEAGLRKRFGGWEDRAADHPQFAEPPPRSTAREVELVHDRDQVHILMGHLGIRRDDPDFYPLVLADYVLGTGPGFTDRLSKQLRDEEGLAYTVSANITRSADRQPGTFAAYIGTSTQTREQALAGMRREIARFVAGPIEEHELEDARRYLLGSFVFGFETPESTAAQLVQMHRLGLGFDYPSRFVEQIESVTAEQVQAAVRRQLHPDQLVTVVIGRAPGEGSA